MGFKTVHGSLMELFPQVDWRILKAVAIEHPKDANAAAEYVVSEVLPNLPRQSIQGSPHEDCSTGGVAGGRSNIIDAEHEEQTESSTHQDVALDLPSISIPSESTCTNDITSVVHRSDSSNQEKAPSPTAVLPCDSEVQGIQVHGNVENEELILLVRPQRQEDVQSSANQTSELMSTASSYEENTNLSQVFVSTETEVPALLGKSPDINVSVGHEETSQFLPTTWMVKNGSSGGSSNEHRGKLKDINGLSADDFDMPQSGTCPHVESVNVTDIFLKNSVVEETTEVVQDHLQLVTSAAPIDSCKTLKSNEDIRIDFLEDIVEAAKNNKKTLFLAMESSMNMMRQVELQEKLAEQAKEEAASAGLDILKKVEELEQMLRHAKEANDMHAGEIYGEKAILATEVRELQGRLLSLSDERDKALAILDEMNQTLETRLAAAEELRKAAEKQKLEKEESAKKALAEQEAIMDKVVQESKILQRQAEENSKLREFLVDRGHVVDTLQGEISVICQDVRLLKERFDENVPLSKSISSTQTSCILASSGSSSSLKSTGSILGSSIRSSASDLASEPRDTSKSPKERSPTSSIHDQSPKSQHEEDKRTDRKELLDEGWDFFEEPEM